MFTSNFIMFTPNLTIPKFIEPDEESLGKCNRKRRKLRKKSNVFHSSKSKFLSLGHIYFIVCKNFFSLTI